MSNTLEQHVRIRLGHDILSSVNAVQGDTGREFYFYFDDYTVPTESEIRVYVRKPSGAEVYNYAYLSNEEVVVQPTYQMLAEVGTNQGQIQIISDSKLLTSFPFRINVSESIISSSSITSKDEFLILDELITNARETTAEMNDLIDTVEAQEEIRVSNEDSRQSEENKRATAESARVNAENTRVSEFNDIKDEFAILKSQSQTATDSANNAADAANDAADRANEIADTLEDAISGVINDSVTSSTSTYSSQKIMAELGKLIISSPTEPTDQIINGLWLKEV